MRSDLVWRDCDDEETPPRPLDRLSTRMVAHFQSTFGKVRSLNTEKLLAKLSCFRGKSCKRCSQTFNFRDRHCTLRTATDISEFAAELQRSTRLLPSFRRILSPHFLTASWRGRCLVIVGVIISRCHDEVAVMHVCVRLRRCVS